MLLVPIRPGRRKPLKKLLPPGRDVQNETQTVGITVGQDLHRQPGCLSGYYLAGVAEGIEGQESVLLEREIYGPHGLCVLHGRVQRLSHSRQAFGRVIAVTSANTFLSFPICFMSRQQTTCVMPISGKGFAG